MKGKEIIITSKNVGGIDLSRVINKDYLLSLGDFYKCNLCSKIMVNPTDCESCGHSFCNECISKSNCPFGCDKKAFKPASMGIKNLLNNLKFKCSNEGCKETIEYIDVKTHDNICPFQIMICPNKDCEEQLLKKNLENHIKNNCKYTLIKCSYCNYKFPRYQIQEHEKICSVASQSFNSSSGNILNLSNANNNKQDENAKPDSNNYIETLSKNIDLVLKDNKILNDNINNENNIENKIENNKEDNKGDNENNKEDNIEKNKEENKLDNKNNNEKNIEINENIINANDINNNINIEENNTNINNNNENKNTNNKIHRNNSSSSAKNNNNIFNMNENNNQNESAENNNELSRLSLRQSVAQIEEDDLIDILKKAIEEKLNERFVNFDSNLDKLVKDINTIKTFVCKPNPLPETKLKPKDEVVGIGNKEIDNIKDYLKEVIGKAENEINLSIKNLNEEINKEINDNKNIIKMQASNGNNINNDYIIKEINQKIDEITNKIIEDINKTNIEINNINQKIQNDIGKIIPELEKNDESNNIDKNIISDLENIFKNIIENNNKEYSAQIIKIIDDKINNINQNNEINTEKDEKEKINEEITENINEKFNLMNNDIKSVNDEIQTIKTNVNEITNLISAKFKYIIDLISNNNNDNSNKKNDEKNLISLNINKSSKNNNMNDFSFKAIEEKPESPKNTNQNNIRESQILIPINEKLKKNLLKKNKQNIMVSKNSNNHDDSFNSLEKENEEEKQYIENENKTKVMNILSGLESKITLLDNYSKTIPDLIKDKISNNLESHILDLGKKIGEDLDKKINEMFGLRYCEECEKVDYFYGFMKCSICLRDNCKQCISICITCKLLVCKKCCNCPGCKKLYCLNCRKSCEQCNRKYCISCLSNCYTCSKHICNDCLKTCNICQNLNCDSCAKNCYICKKNLCNKCGSFKIAEIFSNCAICNKTICSECGLECQSCNENICKNCYFDCEKCKKKICFYCSKKCGLCGKNYCVKCSLGFEQKKCYLCNKQFCNNCSTNIAKCANCNKIICKDCNIQCFQCNSNCCKNCFKKCSNCNNKVCIKCLNKCICGLIVFCGKCLLLNEEISPHECTQFINDKSVFDSIKTRSIKKLNKNFEAKFFLEKKSNKGRTLIGITDIDENLFENDTQEEILGVWTFMIGSGEKYSSEKKLEPFMDSDVKEKDNIYIMKKNDKLFFKINDNEYKLAFELSKKDYFIYLENTNEKYCSVVKFIYIREIDEKI